MDNIRIKHLKTNEQNIESWIAMYNNELIGYIYMLKEDNMRIKFLEAWIHDDHKSGDVTFKMLLDARWDYVVEQYMGWVIYS